MLFNARCLCTFYSFLPIGMGAIRGEIYRGVCCDQVASPCLFHLLSVVRLQSFS